MSDAIHLQVLLVEDDESLGLMVKKRLESIHYLANVTVYWKRNLHDALAFVTAVRPDAILLDLGLPDSKGLKSFIDLHERAPDTPIVIVSATDDRDTIVKAIKYGAQDYIVKGKMDPLAITVLLQKAIERHAAERADYHERKAALHKSLKSLRGMKHQTNTEKQETIAEVMETVLTMMSGEGEPIEDDPA